MVQGGGEKFKVLLTFSDELFNLDFPFQEQDDSSIVLGISEFNSSHSIAANRIKLEKGERLDVEIVPMLVAAAPEVLSVDLDKRRCKFDQEGDQDNQMFYGHTQATCETECMAKEVMRVCGSCIPWNMPQVS